MVIQITGSGAQVQHEGKTTKIIQSHQYSTPRSCNLAVRISRTALDHLATEHVERATDGDTVTATINLENGQKRLEDTAETLSGNKTSGESIRP